MADHSNDLVVDELLRDLRGRARVGTVVLTANHQHDLLTANHQSAGIDFFDRKACAVFVVLAQVGNRSSERGDVSNFDSLVGNRGRNQRRKQSERSANRQQIASPNIYISLLPLLVLDFWGKCPVPLRTRLYSVEHLHLTGHDTCWLAELSSV